MIMKNIYIVYLVLFSNLVNAQDSLLLGKWQIVEIIRDSVVVFNRDSIEISIAARVKNALKTKDSLLHSDSIEIIQYVNSVHPIMNNMYYEFSGTGSLTAGVLDSKNGEFYISTRQGGYMLDGAKIGIHFGSIQSFIYELNDENLILWDFKNGTIDRKGYIKLKKE